MGIYKRKILRKKERKHAFDQERKKKNKILTERKRKKTRSLPRKTGKF